MAGHTKTQVASLSIWEEIRFAFFLFASRACVHFSIPRNLYSFKKTDGGTHMVSGGRRVMQIFVYDPNGRGGII